VKVLSLLALGTTHSPHDSGVRQVAAFSARFAYVLMCLTLAWGIFAATGLITRLTGRHAIRGSHLVLAVLTLAFGVLHALCFLLLTDTNERFRPAMLLVPLVDGGAFRWGLGIIGLELMLAIAVSVLVQRFVVYRRWLRFHQVAYFAVAVTALHAWLGAAANGHLDVVTLAGLTVTIPTVMLVGLRFAPPGVLIWLGLIDNPDPGRTRAPSAPLTMSVDNNRCRFWRICQLEAPDLFDVATHDRLRYQSKVPHGDEEQARSAARCCPARAIHLSGELAGGDR
jgi:ferredoxin/DMSO/TMAO reductase YedYZ heme-binding membrane subunit